MSKRKGKDAGKGSIPVPDIDLAPVRKTVSTKKQQKNGTQRTLKSFFSTPTGSGKLFVVRPNVELEIEINLSDVATGTKTKILHFIVLELPAVAQEISTTSATAKQTTTAINTTKTSTISTSSASVEPTTSQISISLTATAHVNINTDDGVADEGTISVDGKIQYKL